MKEINIIDAGKRGAYEYHVRLYSFKLDYNKEKRTLEIGVLYPEEVLKFVDVKIESIEQHEIVLLGSEPIPSGSGKLPPLRKIILTL